MPGYPGGQNTRRQFDQGVAGGYFGFAGGAAAAQDEPADHREILQRRDGRLAVGAGGAGGAEGEALDGGCWCRRFGASGENLRSLRSPLAFQDDRQAVDDDVEETADDQAQEKN